MIIFVFLYISAWLKYSFGNNYILSDMNLLQQFSIELFNNSDAILNRDALWSIQGKNHHVNAAIVRGIRRTGKILR